MLICGVWNERNKKQKKLPGYRSEAFFAVDAWDSRHTKLNYFCGAKVYYSEFRRPSAPVLDNLKLTKDADGMAGV